MQRNISAHIQENKCISITKFKHLPLLRKEIMFMQKTKLCGRNNKQPTVEDDDYWFLVYLTTLFQLRRLHSKDLVRWFVMVNWKIRVCRSRNGVTQNWLKVFNNFHQFFLYIQCYELYFYLKLDFVIEMRLCNSFERRTFWLIVGVYSSTAVQTHDNIEKTVYFI